MDSRQNDVTLSLGVSFLLGLKGITNSAVISSVAIDEFLGSVDSTPSSSVTGSPISHYSDSSDYCDAYLSGLVDSRRQNIHGKASYGQTASHVKYDLKNLDLRVSSATPPQTAQRISRSGRKIKAKRKRDTISFKKSTGLQKSTPRKTSTRAQKDVVGSHVPTLKTAGARPETPQTPIKGKLEAPLVTITPSKHGTWGTARRGDGSQVKSAADHVDSEIIRTVEDFKIHRGKKLLDGRWSTLEHQGFLVGLKTFGNKWRAISQMLGSRTAVQVRTHAQKHFAKLEKKRMKEEQMKQLDMLRRQQQEKNQVHMRAGCCQTEPLFTNTVGFLRDRSMSTEASHSLDSPVKFLTTRKYHRITQSRKSRKKK